MPRLSKIGAAALAAFGWTTGAAAVTANYVLVAGGGASGGGNEVYPDGGGGGAGGLLSGTISLNPTLSYTVVVGAGGAGVPTSSAAAQGGNGSNSTFTGLTTAIGGGGGGIRSSSGTINNGLSGGSGGGAAINPGGTDSGTAGTNTVGQGNPGGTAQFGGNPYGGGGGGGAGGIGGNGSGSGGGAGGVGLQNPITGSTTGQLSGGIYYLAGGGGGAGRTGTSTGGLGGGGAGGIMTVGTPGTANTGGGAGGSDNSIAVSGVNGGSGVVIISYVGAQQFGGGVVTSSGGNTIHTFTTSGTLSPLSSLTASYLIVAGGGGGSFGGAGAGGLLSGSSLTIDTNSIYAVTVGAGGAGQDALNVTGTNGSNSAFSMVSTTALGGGGGGKALAPLDGASGGSGGGGGNNGAGGAGTSGQGNNGGAGYSDNASYGLGGGGGGASAVGQSLNSSSNAGGNGGAGSASSITGSSVTYAGGGGGGGHTAGSRPGGTGGAGGGGNGTMTGNASSGTAGLGGGGGGAGSASGNGGNGGSGVVIISYPGSTQQMAGGTVTVAGGNVIHTFTSSGYLTPIVLVNNSLRFRGSNSAKLSRTVTTSSSSTKGSFSAWVKRGKDYDSTNNGCLVSAADNYYYGQFFNQGLYFGNTTNWMNTAAVYRDPAAWYHVFFVFDTTQATSTDRLQIWVNGVRQTAGGTTSYPSPNASFPFLNSVQDFYIGGRASDGFFDGEMAEVNFVDGQALTPNSFGTSNGLGVWQPIRYGGSYGTNGFYLPFNGRNSTYGGGFNGTNQYLSLSGFTPNWSTYTNFTVEMWIYVAAYPAVVAKVFGTEPAGSSGAYSIGYFDSTGTLAFGISTVNQFNSASGAISTGKWTHLAYVRNGSNLNIYVNGTSVASTTSASTYCSNNTNPFLIGQAATYYLNGSISNFRFTNTAVYTGTFVPPTSPLTAISGTQLLTLQNATIIDNSTNAYTITNNNAVVMTEGTNIFANPVSLAADQSPAGNNWTANNISTTTGSTYDSMTDVPTLTSATVANYATINPLDYNSTYLTLSAANLQQTYAGVAAAAASRATMTLPTTGKYYWEITLTTIGTNNTTIRAGICSPTTAISGNSIDDASTAYLQITNGDKRNNASASTYGAGFSNGQILQVLYDATAGAIYFGQNNSFANGSGSFNQTFSTATAAFTGLSGEFMPCFITYGGSDIAVNFGQRPFAYTPPTGFNRLNTFNLTTPTIGATASTTANKYFDATTYTGNGTGQSITNSGSMQPDFIWIKDRSVASAYALTNSVTGITKYLESNTTAAETTDTTSVTAINSNGFSLGAGTSTYFTNRNGEAFVAWQWRASNATAVTNTDGTITSTVSANTTAGFSIVTWTGNGVTAATVGHGLGVVPAMIICKERSASGEYWHVKHQSTASNTNLFLNRTQASTSAASVGDGILSDLSSSTTFGFATAGSPGNVVAVNENGVTNVAYVFAQVAGYSAFGSYTGNGSSDGTFVYTGFRPRFIMLKASSFSTASTVWALFDTSRSPYNASVNELYANLADAELIDGSGIDILSNGFKPKRNSEYANSSGQTYIYMAFAESPFKYANAR